MRTTLEKIAAGDVSRILSELGIPKDKPVTVLAILRSLRSIAD